MVLPFPGHLSPTRQTPKNPDLPKPLNSIQAHCSLHPRLWLLITFLSVQIFVLFVTRTVPLPASLFPATKTKPSAAAANCPLGRIYVYNLPPSFNKDLIDTCNDSDPWHWRCGAVSNDGFGPIAAELARVVPGSVAPAWYWTNQFALEILFHNRLLNHECRTLEPESAAAFYIPFYAGLAVGKYLWANHTMRDRDCELVIRWVRKQPFWRRSNGADHFITLGRITWDFRRLDDPSYDWGSSLLNMPAMRRVTRLIVERAPRDDNDVGVPYPTGFHPSSISDVVNWQGFVRNRNRTSLFCFVGAARADIKDDIRAALMSQCRNESGSCRVVDCARAECANGRTSNLETFLDSDFCLQPKGDSYTRRSVFDCMLAGSIPVFFWFRTAYTQYKWFLPGQPESYSVFIEPRDVVNGRSIRSILEGYSKEDVRRMREKVIETIPRFVYAKPSEGLGSRSRDAFDIAVNGVLNRFRVARESRSGRGTKTQEGKANSSLSDSSLGRIL
ncbi:hypothetical protein RHGRI_029295 [Rhododendron griersonianum]|uniref:Exostosin GT47 domain-containing protein n=1 Tax=Rhododendron griersonianum TaxID=479676 RepID=A0AAV6IJ11_9ERIC|nr:hypothetical protein RHGRI_029295 [Rhododendron griersonianum]